MWTGSLGAQAPHRWSLSGGPRQPKNLGSQGPWDEALDKESWAPVPSKASPGALRWSWDKPVGDGGSPRVAPCRGSGFAMRPLLRRWYLGDSPDEGGRQEWTREPPAQPRQGAKEHSLGTVTWTYI